MKRQLIAFVVAGGLAAGANFLSRMFLSHYFAFSLSIIIAYIIGMITAFVLMKCFVFEKSQNSLMHSVWYFVLINLLAVLQTWGVSMLLAYVVLPGLSIEHNVFEIAHAVGVAVPVGTSFLGHKYFTFKQ